MKNLLDNAPNQPTKFRTKHWNEINDDARGTYNNNSKVEFKNSMLKTSLSDYIDAYILVGGSITITAGGDNDAAKKSDERNKGVIFNECLAPFNDCISEINNTQIDNAKDLDVVMPTYSLIECSNNYSKTLGNLWQYYRDEPNDNIANSKSFRPKIKITGNTPNADS